MTPLRLFEIDAFEDRPAHQPEVAVDVADRQAEQQADDVVIETADDDPVQRIRPADLVAVHQIGVRRHARPQRGQLRRVVLRVAVGVENQLLGRRRETRSAAHRRSRGSSRGARPARADRCAPVRRAIAGVASALPSLTTMTSKSGVSSAAACTARMTMLAMVPLSLYAGKKTLRPAGSGPGTLTCKCL